MLKSVVQTPIGKRKSSDCDADERENIQPNIIPDQSQSAKKSKVNKSKLAIPSKLTQIRTGLPRFNQTKTQTSVQGSSNELNKKAGTQTHAQVLSSESTKKNCTNDTTTTPLKKNIPKVTTTPGQLTSPIGKKKAVTEQLDSNSIAYNSSEALKKLQKFSTCLQVTDKIRMAFETSITLTEEKVVDIINSKLGKSKKNNWNFKEKVDKQAEVIKDLRSFSKNMFEELKMLKESCLSIENSQTSSNREIISVIDENVQSFSGLILNDSRLRKEVTRLTEELALSAASTKSFQSENAPLKASIKELEDKHWKVIEKLACEEAVRNSIEAENARLKLEIDALKQESSENSSNLKTQYEQVFK